MEQVSLCREMNSIPMAQPPSSVRVPKRVAMVTNKIKLPSLTYPSPSSCQVLTTSQAILNTPSHCPVDQGESTLHWFHCYPCPCRASVSPCVGSGEHIILPLSFHLGYTHISLWTGKKDSHLNGQSSWLFSERVRVIFNFLIQGESNGRRNSPCSTV